MSENNIFLEFDGRPDKKVVNSPFEISDYQKAPPKMPPVLGENTYEILKDLGYSSEELDDMNSEKAIFIGSD